MRKSFLISGRSMSLRSSGTELRRSAWTGRDLLFRAYCNDGDWVESLTALVEHADGRLEIADWSAQRRVGAAPALVRAVGGTRATDGGVRGAGDIGALPGMAAVATAVSELPR